MWCIFAPVARGLIININITEGGIFFHSKKWRQLLKVWKTSPEISQYVTQYSWYPPKSNVVCFTVDKRVLDFNDAIAFAVSLKSHVILLLRVSKHLYIALESRRPPSLAVAPPIRQFHNLNFRWYCCCATRTDSHSLCLLICVLLRDQKRFW